MRKVDWVTGPPATVVESSSTAEVGLELRRGIIKTQKAVSMESYFRQELMTNSFFRSHAMGTAAAQLEMMNFS